MWEKFPTAQAAALANQFSADFSFCRLCIALPRTEPAGLVGGWGPWLVEKPLWNWGRGSIA